MRLRALEKEVARLADAQERLATVAEAVALKAFNYVPPSKVKLSEEDKQVEVVYTDEEQDAIMEIRRRFGKVEHDGTEEEVL
jgi:hypothetical protein